MDFNTTYRKHFHHILYYAKKIVGQEGAEEVVVHAFVALWRNQGKIKTDGHALGFLLRVAKNKCIELQRWQGRQPVTQLWGQFEDLHLPAGFYDEPEVVKGDFLTYLLEKGIEKLPKKTRRVIELSMQGYKPADIATETGLNVQTIMNQKAAGLKVLRTFMMARSV